MKNSFKNLVALLLLFINYMAYGQMTASIEIKNKTEYLKINNNGAVKQLNLYKIGFYDQDFTLLAFKENDNSTKFLLKFNYLSNPTGSGVCSEGGMETGCLLLTYDKQFMLIDKQRVLLESCSEGVSYEEVPTTETGVKKYVVTDLDEKKIRVTINIQALEIKID